MTHTLSALARAALVALLLAASTAPAVLAQDATPVPNPALAQQLADVAAETAEIRELDALADIDDVVLTNAAGVHADALAESVMAGVLSHVKRLPERAERSRAEPPARLRVLPRGTVP